MKRTYAIIMAVILIFSLCISVSAGDQVQYNYSTKANSGVRHEICTTLEGTSADSYYTGSYSYDTLITLESDELLTSLRTLMTDTHTKESTYNNCRDMAVLTDCENGDGTSISLIYTSYSSCWAEWTNNIAGGWNREHVWPQSLGGFKTTGAGSDLHHIRPVDSTVNSTRGNMKYGNVNGGSAVYGTSVTKHALGGHRGTPYFEPLDNAKGDIARIILYMYVRYGADSRYNCQSITTVFESVEVLLEWCALDPVDTWEMGRNEVVAAFQGNRNVFIDYPELAWLIFDEQIPTPMTTPSGRYTHPYEAVVTPPTCTEQGFTTFTCPDCGDSYVGNFVAPLGHNYEDDICTVCGEEKPEDTYVKIYYPAGDFYMTSTVTNSKMGIGTIEEAAIWTLQEDENGYVSFLLDGQYLTSGETGGRLLLTGTFTDYALWDVETADTGIYLRNVAAVYGGTTPQYLEIYNNQFTTYGFTSSDTSVYTFQLVEVPVCEVIGHRYETVVTPSTCTEQGFSIYTCKKCGDSYVSDYTELAAHEGEMGDRCALCNGFINITGTCGTNLLWTITEDGTLTIEGSGKMDNYGHSSNVSPWFPYRTEITSAVVDNGILNIGDYAFYACLNLENISIGESVATIGNSAFMDCTQLETVSIPQGCPTINDYTFKGCTNLTSVTIPNTVTRIGYQAFHNCTSLASIQVPANVTTIGADAFYNCSTLETIVIPEGITNVDHSTFYGCSSLTTVLLPESLTSIDSNAFQGCSSLVSITIPNRVTTIGASAFRSCISLTQITLPANLAKVEDYLFHGCDSLEQVTLQEGIISIGNSAFRNCSSLANIKIPQGTTSIGNYAFARCIGLTSLVIPESVTTIGNYGFYQCVELETVYYTGSDAQWAAISIGSDNAPLVNANIHHSYVDPATCEHSYEIIIIGPTCTEAGYSTYFCPICNDKFVADHKDALGHNVDNGTCTRCSKVFIQITENLTDVRVDYGKSAKLIVTAIGDGLTYTWYYSDNGGESFTATKTFTGNYYNVSMTEQRDGRQVYCVIRDQNGYCATTNTVTLSAIKTVQITKQPVSISVANGQMATVSVQATGDGLTYAWYYSYNGKFYKTDAFTGNTYSVAMNASRAGRQIYCIVTDMYGNQMQSNVVTINMTPSVSIVTQPENVTVGKNEKAVVRVNAIGEGLRYKWYYSDDGGKTFKLTTSFTGNRYSITMTQARAGRQVYCEITDAFGNVVKSNVVTLGMTDCLKILSQPQSVTVAAGKKARVSVCAYGEGLTYSWYYSDNGGKTFSKTSAFSGDTYSISMTSARAGRQIYCVITDAHGNTIKTDVVTIHMK